MLRAYRSAVVFTVCVSRCVWLVVLVVSLAAFVFCTVNCVYEYMSHLRHGVAASLPGQRQQLVAGDDALKLRLPTITLCNLNPIRSPPARLVAPRRCLQKN